MEGEDTRVCARCHDAKPLAFFCKKGGGRSGYQCYCKPCVRAYYKAKGSAYQLKYQNRGRAERHDYIRAIKEQRGCAECGERRHPCLEYHHIDPSKKIAGVWKLANSNAAYARIDAEIAKCMVLCSNCHRVHHYHERLARKRGPHNETIHMSITETREVA